VENESHLKFTAPVTLAVQFTILIATDCAESENMTCLEKIIAALEKHARE
jgi:uncharacterized protein with von Willebrand factor type A (vWA) domain